VEKEHIKWFRHQGEENRLMKLVSWNVNGIRACVKKGFLDYFHEVDADLFCLQETKLQEGQISLELDGYYQYWNYALKKGYSGTSIFTKKKPLTVSYGIGTKEEEPEGRIITLEFDSFFLVNVYVPNAKRDLTRLDYRLEWEDEIREYVSKLDQIKPVIFCGDLNVAHQEIDLRNPKTNKGNSGFTEEERGKMTDLLNVGFIDTFRFLYPDKEGAYSWWSYMSKVRERNIGWRIDYFLASKRLAPAINDAGIHAHILGSDHCPIFLEVDL
jgi:exodeoxyribonuclease III